MSKVLIVDESAEDRAHFREILQRAGFTVHEATTAGETLDQARAANPHAILLDVNLAGDGGPSVCRELRSDVRFADVPILMLTVRIDRADAIAGLEAGADDFVNKNSPPEVVLARVRRLVHFRRMATTAALNESLAQVGRLVTGIVHEIRGPLSVIRGNADLLKLEHGGPDADLSSRIDSIIRTCQLLQLRLEHLMATVRSSSAALKQQDIVPIVTEAAELFRRSTDPRAGKVVIAVTADQVLPRVFVDAGRLIQVLLNLLGNAHDSIMAARGEGRIEVHPGLCVQDGRRYVTIDVMDDGPGIPEALLTQIFEPFFTTKPTGSGYGLYFTHEILREHGGQLSAGNNDNGGAKFRISLPIADQVAAS